MKDYISAQIFIWFLCRNVTADHLTVSSHQKVFEISQRKSQSEELDLFTFKVVPMHNKLYWKYPIFFRKSSDVLRFGNSAAQNSQRQAMVFIPQ